MFQLLIVHWTVDPDIFTLGPLTIRWYGLLFAMGFILGYWHLYKMFQKEKLDDEKLADILTFMIVGTVLGARFGHVFFYEWGYYSQHPSEILKIWHGGLASHGAVIGILIALWLVSKYLLKTPTLWLLDRMAVAVPLGGAFIRLGNLLNHEIVGIPTDSSWGFIFSRLNDGMPRHPAQLYESLAYLLIFIIMTWMYWRTNAKDHKGLLFGFFMSSVFIARFIIEFFKSDQTAFEANLTLNMGQYLSIPVILIGIYFLIYSRKNTYNYAAYDFFQFKAKDNAKTK